jgi:hypothetical protein
MSQQPDKGTLQSSGPKEMGWQGRGEESLINPCVGTGAKEVEPA